MVKIRLTRLGKKRSPFYRIIVADARSPRDGRFIEQLGTYDTRTNPPTINLDLEKAKAWVGKGAQPTDVVASIIEKAEDPKKNKATDYSNKISKKAQNKKDLANNSKEESPAEEEASVEVAKEAPVEETPVEEPAEKEKPAE